MVDFFAERSEIETLLLARLLKRYLNMRSKEILDRVKEKLQTKKKDALRSELGKRKKESKSS